MSFLVAFLESFSHNLPGPDVQIDFSKGDWWLALLAYLLIRWLASREPGKDH